MTEEPLLQKCPECLDESVMTLPEGTRKCINCGANFANVYKATAKTGPTIVKFVPPPFMRIEMNGREVFKGGFWRSIMFSTVVFFLLKMGAWIWHQILNAIF